MSRASRLLSPVGLSWIPQTRAYRSLRDPAWWLSPAAQASRRRLRDLHDSEAGERGFIIGTGPSLHHVDFSKLRGRRTIGLNRLFLGFQTFDFIPEHMVCVNLLMIEHSANQLQDLPCPLIAAWAARRHLGPARGHAYIRTLAGVGFSKTLDDHVFTGGTVTHVALQYAFWLGWSSVTLIGIDHNYALEPEEARAGPHGVVTRDTPDQNHFVPNYFGKGAVWQVPDLDQSEAAYRLARSVFEEAGREVVDGTVGGRLQVFERSEISYRKE